MERERSQGDRGIPDPIPGFGMGEDMPRKPLDAVTRKTLMPVQER